MASESLILTGFMAVGKSTVGPMAAEQCGVAYFDTDEWMEKEGGIDVPELVRTDIQEFRRVEAEALKTILGSETGIIATGGGIVSTQVGRSALRYSCVPVVWLQAPFEVSSVRQADDEGRERPLFSDLAAAERLYYERQPLYDSTATHRVDATQPPEMVAGMIAQILRPK